MAKQSGTQRVHKDLSSDTPSKVPDVGLFQIPLSNRERTSKACIPMGLLKCSCSNTLQSSDAPPPPKITIVIIQGLFGSLCYFACSPETFSEYFCS